MIVLPDTSVIVRYLTKDHETLFAKAKAFFDGVLEGRSWAVILESVVAESLYVLTKVYKVPKEEAAQGMIAILRYKGIVNPDKDRIIEALKLFSSRRLGLSDCTLCIKASRMGFSLLSFDEELMKVYGSGK